MIEENPITFGHSKVPIVKPHIREADVLHLGSRQQCARHTASLECHAREGGLSDIRAREVACLHHDIYQTKAVEISRCE